MKQFPLIILSIVVAVSTLLEGKQQDKPKPEQASSVEENFINFDTPKCRRSGQSGYCEIKITNKDEYPRAIKFLQNYGYGSRKLTTKIYDDQGKECGIYSRGKNGEQLPIDNAAYELGNKGTVNPIIFQITGISPNAKKISKFVIAYCAGEKYCQEQRDGMGGKSFTTSGVITFQNIIID